MFEDLVGKKVKLVFRDGDNTKAVPGILVNTEDGFLRIDSENGNVIVIGIDSIVSVKVVE